MNRLGHSKNARFELTQTQAGQQKRASEKALDLNGGVDVAKFELFKKYYEHLTDTTITRNICNYILKLIA